MKQKFSLSLAVALALALIAAPFALADNLFADGVGWLALGRTEHASTQSVRAPIAEAVGPTLSISMTVVTPQPILSGNPVTWEISWECSSVEATPCLGARIDVTKPTLTGNGSAVGAPGFTTAAFVDGVGAHYIFIDPLPAGSSGTLQLQYFSVNLHTPDGTVLTPVATFSATNLTSVQASAGAEIDSAMHLAITKRRLAITEPPLDVDVTYEINFFDSSWPNYSNALPGTWTVMNAVVRDTLPPGAVFVSATNGGTYDAAIHTVTWPAIPDVAAYEAGCVGYHICYYVTIHYPSSSFTSDNDPADPSDNVTNQVTIVGKPYNLPGGPDVTAQASATHGFMNQPDGSGTFTKALSGCALKVSSGVRGGNQAFDLCWFNPSSVPATFTATDWLPCPTDSPTGLPTPCENPGLRPTKFRVGYPVINGVVAVNYTTNLGNTGTISLSVPYVSKSPGVDDDSPRTFNPGEFVSHFTVTGSLAGGFSQFLQFEGTIAPDFPDVPAIDPDVMTNCAQGSLDFGAFGGVQGPFDSCARIEIVPPKPIIYHFKGGTSLGAIAPTEARSFALAAAPCGDLPWHPVLTDLLPSNLRYVPGTQTSNAAGFPSLGGVPPTFEVIEDFNGTGRQLLRWSWPGGQAMTECQYLGITFHARVEPGTPPGTYTNYGQFFDAAFTDNNTRLTNICVYAKEPDLEDFDGDGNMTEYRCIANTDYTVVETASMVVTKEVRGSFDASFKAPPAIGLANPGSAAEYRISLQNTGNLTLTNLVAYDILPFIGDTGVSGTQLGTPRGSQWQPVLAGAVTPPTGGMVEYSMSTNPCRGEVIAQGGALGSGPSGCVNDWTTSPASFSAVRAIRISLGSTLLAGGESRTVIVPMTAPVGVEGIAWNTVALAGQNAGTSTWLLPTEPPKVGLAVPIDLELDKTVSPATSVLPGATLTYTVTVTNQGPGSATGVTVKDMMPAGLTLQSATPSVGSYDSVTGLWTVGSLAPNESATLTITTTVDTGTEGTTIVNYAQVSAANDLELDSTPDNNPGPTPSEDDEAAVSTPVVIQATPSITTSAVTDVTVGENIHDTASMSGLVNPDGTGSITFRLYSDAACTNQVFTDTVSGISANGDYVSADHATTATGSYYWVASFSGDPNNEPASTNCGDEGETSIVNKAGPSLLTTPDPSSGTVGVPLNDSATLSDGFNPTGTITFDLYDPSDATCSGAPAFTDVVPVNGNGTYPTSSGFASNAVGVWHWTATYSGDSNNNPASSGCADEPVTVSAGQPIKVTGGGEIAVPDPTSRGKATFGFNAQQNEAGSTAATGHFNYVNHDTGLHVNGSVNDIQVIATNPDGSPKTVQFSGTCDGNGPACTFIVTVEDHGEPGTEDEFGITVTGELAESQSQRVISKGNIQFHIR
ncbi:MAG TPA: DUF11 domain-containing protein [Anaerolineales bacterium]|nr:DUF11 domain-containing protein [Anaerolineales bacterium]